MGIPRDYIKTASNNVHQALKVATKIIGGSDKANSPPASSQSKDIYQQNQARAEYNSNKAADDRLKAMARKRAPRSSQGAGSFSDARANLKWINNMADRSVDKYGPMNHRSLLWRSLAVFYNQSGAPSAQRAGEAFGDPNTSTTSKVLAGGSLGLDALQFLPVAKAGGTALKGMTLTGTSAATRATFRSARVGGFAVPVSKAVNSGINHAVKQSVTRNIFASAAEATEALKGLSKAITQNKSFPPGSMVDPSRPDRVLVPFGDLGMVVYKVGKNQTAKLKTVLNAKFGPGY